VISARGDRQGSREHQAVRLAAINRRRPQGRDSRRPRAAARGHVARPDLNEKRARAYRLADNPLNEEGSWDHELPAVELTDLGEAAGDLTGLDPAEIAELLGGDTDLADPPAQLDKARELQAKWARPGGVPPHRLQSCNTSI